MRQNDVATLFWCDYTFIVTVCVSWNVFLFFFFMPVQWGREWAIGSVWFPQVTQNEINASFSRPDDLWHIINMTMTWIITLCVTWDPFCCHGLLLIAAWVNDYMLSKVRDELTYPFPNYNGATVKVWECNFVPRFILDVIIYPCAD